MFASIRSIKKNLKKVDGTWESKCPKHNNKGNKRGRAYYTQVVVDKEGKPVKTIIHLLSQAPDAWKPARKKKRLRKSMESPMQN